MKALASLLAVLAALLFCVNATARQPISYQGQLQQSGLLYTGQADLQFRLYDSLSGGSQVGAAIVREDWPVEDGLFQVELDFGPGSFGTDPRWLEIIVDGVVLDPRQPVNAAPLALFALDGNPGPEGPPGDSHWIINGSATAYLDGAVGIGTDTPAAALDVRADSTIAVPQMYLVEQQDDYARLSFGNTVSERFWSLAALTRGDNPRLDRFNVFHSTGADVLIIDGEGSIAVGGNLPVSTYRLSVGEGLLVTRETDSSTGSVPHLALLERTGPEPVRQLFWNSDASRGWRIDATLDAADADNDRWSLLNFGTGGTGEQFTLLGSGALGIDFPDPPAALAVRSRDAWTWGSGNGRGDFHLGDGLVGLSMGVALGGGGRGVSRIWTNGGVEHLFIGSATHGLTMAILPGQIGVNTSSPTAALDVEGSARLRDLGHTEAARTVHADAQGNLSTTPRASFVVIPSTAFTPARPSSEPHTVIPTGFAIDNAFGLDAIATAPVAGLPHGAVVTGLDLWYFDDSVETLAITLLECPHEAFGFPVSSSCAEITTVETVGQSSVQTRTIQAAPGLAATIDLENNAYHILAASSFWTPDLILRSVRLRYEY